MARILIASTPLHGHVAPLLGVAEELTRRSHEVTFVTGRRFARSVSATGAHHVALPAGADFDDRDLDAAFPERRSRGRIGRVNVDIARMLAGPLPHQVRALDEADAELHPQVVLVDTTFLGGFAWKAAGGADRPPLVVANITFLTIAGRGVPPAGVGLAPMAGIVGRVRDTAVRTVTERVLVRSAIAHLDQVCAAAIGRRLPGLLFDGPRLADRLLVLTVPSFEYPRRDLPEQVRFVGPVLPPASGRFEPPGWWPELDGGRPVVHVTQGTFDNADLGRLLEPTLSALADDEVLVVATTGGPPASSVPGPVPSNARIEPYLPYEHLLPRVDAMVTNGGYGGVQLALAHGLPLVVAGDGEDKPEVGARVAWSGVGLNLRTGRPRPAALRTAVRRLLTEPSFKARAAAMQAEMRGYHGARCVAEIVEALAAPDAAPTRPAESP
jgi:UDP:flavonoid glycosyltransferase YjiC (YdhE family)